MECDICGSTSSASADFYCPACVRGMLYHHRLKLARGLLDRERLGKRIKAIATRPATEAENGNLGVDDLAVSKQAQHDRQLAEIDITKDRIERILEASDSLKNKIDAYKKEVANTKKSQMQCRLQIKKDSSDLYAVQNEQLQAIQGEIRKKEQMHELIYSDLLDGRIWLCHEAATIHGLRRVSQPSIASGQAAETYEINHITIPDLRDIPKISAEMITTSLTQVCRLLCLNAAYLGVRLPAEIVLPGPNWPLPTIFPPSVSYHDFPTAFPHTSSAHNSNILPTKAPQSSLIYSNSTSAPRPRPLFLAQPLPALAREDPQTYALFIEGISLLSWNIVWLCRTQGIDLGSTEWTDVCDIGKNMYTLFIEAPKIARKKWQERERAKREISRTADLSSVKFWNRTNADISIDDQLDSLYNHRIERDRERQRRKEEKRNLPTPLFGHRSHTTSFAFLNSPNSLTRSLQGLDVYNRSSSGTESGESSASATSPSKSESNGNKTTSKGGWILANPQRVRDALRSYLLAEMQGAEWEVLGSGELKGMMEESTVVLVGKKRQQQQKQDEPDQIAGQVQEAGIRAEPSVNGTKDKAGVSTAQDKDGAFGENDGTDQDGVIARNGTPDQVEKRKVNGWTKVKSRTSNVA